METQIIELSASEVATALEILAGRQKGNKNDAEILIKSIIKGSDLKAELPSKGFDLKQFQK
jgi:hypothetical protein